MVQDYSQWGEQAILSDILARLPNPNHWCVDVGAGDGINGSNTQALVEAGYNAILIEGDTDRFAQLQANTPQNAVAIGQVVRPTGYTSLEAILANTNTPRDFDLLSIDIDGQDYNVWKHLTNYEPKVVVIEFNPTMAVDLFLVQDENDDRMLGSSLLAITDLAESKGYRLVAATVTNGIFMRKELCLGLKTSDLSLWQDRRFMTRCIYDYEGNRYLQGCNASPWRIDG